MARLFAELLIHYRLEDSALGFNPGFQPWEPPPRAIRPEGAADRTY